MASGLPNYLLSEVKLFSHVRLFATPWTVAYRIPQSMEFSRQEYWSGLPFPSPNYLLTGVLFTNEVLSQHYFQKFAPSSVLSREGNGTPLQCSCLEGPMSRGAWQAAVHGAPTSQTRLSNFTFTFHFHALDAREVRSP